VSPNPELHSDQQKASLRKRADLQVARIELKDLLGATTVDDKAVAAKVKELGDLQASVLRARVDGQLAFRKVLTPEQFEKLKAMRMDQPRGPRPDRLRRGPGRPGPRGGPGGQGHQDDPDDEDGPALTGPEGR
jgi:Spy/CpxP family protein refolding chaperone